MFVTLTNRSWKYIIWNRFYVNLLSQNSFTRNQGELKNSTDSRDTRRKKMIGMVRNIWTKMTKWDYIDTNKTKLMGLNGI